MRVFGLGPTELIIILAIILLLFGPKQIPKLAKMFGKAAKDLRDGFDGGEEESAAPKQAISEATVTGQNDAESAAKRSEETPAS